MSLGVLRPLKFYAFLRKCAARGMRQFYCASSNLSEISLILFLFSRAFQQVPILICATNYRSNNIYKNKPLLVYFSIGLYSSCITVDTIIQDSQSITVIYCDKIATYVNCQLLLKIILLQYLGLFQHFFLPLSRRTRSMLIFCQDFVSYMCFTYQTECFNLLDLTAHVQ